jgi:hypothetical protein
MAQPTRHAQYAAVVAGMCGWCNARPSGGRHEGGWVVGCVGGWEGFTAHGEVRLIGAHIGGQLDFTRASLSNPDGVTLELDGASAGVLFLLPQERPDGVVDLTNARVGSFHDEPARWPVAMRLRGFTYEVLENDTVSVRQRLSWLARHQGG